MAGINLSDICNAKFQIEGGKVLAFFETYELVQEYPESRLLVLVDRQKTSALFSCFLSQNINQNSIGLSVDKNFSINNDFWLQLIPENLQFTVSNEKESALFYYFSESDDAEFEKFLEEVRSAEANCQNSDYEDIASVYSYKCNEDTATKPVCADSWMRVTKRELNIQNDFLGRKNEYSTFRPLNIYVATWNVNDQSPEDIILDTLLNADLTGGVPDIYAIGLQEIDRSALGITMNRSKPDEVWIERIVEGLNPNEDYEPLETVRMVGMQLTIVVRKELLPQISRHSVGSAAIKGYRMKRNRGAVGISIQINDSSFCFVNAHFGTYWTEVPALKAIHNKILRRMQFSAGKTQRRILEHEHVFWFGDLNFRIEEPFNLDQLSLEKERKQVFVGFEEGERMFEPTYRYEPGTDRWEFSKKCPLPAYTDRILWKSKDTKQLSYSSIMRMRLSDHKPVFSLLTTEVRTCDARKSLLVYDEVVKAVDECQVNTEKEARYEDISYHLHNSIDSIIGSKQVQKEDNKKDTTLIDYGGALLEEGEERSEQLKDIMKGVYLEKEDATEKEPQNLSTFSENPSRDGESLRSIPTSPTNEESPKKNDPKAALAEAIREIEQLLKMRSGD